MDNFFVDIKEFIDNFEGKFVKYFTSSEMMYNQNGSKENMNEVAIFIYKDIFKEESVLLKEDNSIVQIIKEDNVKINFLIALCMVHFSKNYIEYAKPDKPLYLERIITITADYIDKLCENSPKKQKYINFDTNDNALFGGNLIDTFKKVKDIDGEVAFFNLYQGVPITTKAKITKINVDEISFDIEQIQEIAMREDGSAYILRDENFEKYIKADIVYQDSYNNSLVLNNFTYLLNMPASQRKAVRVHPNIIAEVNLLGDKNILTRGKLYDLSINGMGVIGDNNNGLYVGAKIDVNFNIFSYEHTKSDIIEVTGEVVDIIEYDDSYRYCIHITPNEEMEKRIIKYVTNREAEILTSLKQKLKI